MMKKSEPAKKHSKAEMVILVGIIAVLSLLIMFLKFPR